MLVAEEPSPIKSERRDGICLREVIMESSPHSLKIRLSPKPSPTDELRKFQLVSLPLMPILASPPMPTLPSLYKTSESLSSCLSMLFVLNTCQARVSLLFVLVTGKSTTNHSVEVKYQPLDPLLVPPLVHKVLVSLSLLRSLPAGLFDPDKVAYESTTSHDHHWADTDCEGQDSFELPVDEDEEGDPLDDAREPNRDCSQSRNSCQTGSVKRD
ncbi:hypothetical protein PQX77_019557 [Marasmius sp. AFHP31]|nr:hypothetical protein PQX77_019557 [Marasmius sp. AFHP31]